MNTSVHWEHVYATKKPDQVSWYRPHLDVSLRLIAAAASEQPARIIDVGGGESTLVDDLLERGYGDVAVLDLSATAIEVAQRRLGSKAEAVQWLHGDVTTFPLPRNGYDIWHDRAVFHFLTKAGERAAYVRQVGHCVRRGGHVVVATFGPAGPTQCSGLDVVRYDADSLHAEFGARFELVDHVEEAHQTPWGSIQQFVYCYCHVRGDRRAANPRR
jgi:SAM-dependent methyltransferase